MHEVDDANTSHWVCLSQQRENTYSPKLDPNRLSKIKLCSFAASLFPGLSLSPCTFRLERSFWFIPYKCISKAILDRWKFLNTTQEEGYCIPLASSSKFDSQFVLFTLNFMYSVVPHTQQRKTSLDFAAYDGVKAYLEHHHWDMLWF